MTLTTSWESFISKTVNLNQLAQKLKASNSILSTVESCTGGFMAHLLTNLEGSSQFFWGGRVVYHPSCKEALGVPSQVLATYGTVSQETTLYLAQQGLQELKIHYPPSDKNYLCLAITGFAGSASQEELAGLCWIALSSSKSSPLSRKIEIDPGSSRPDTKWAFTQKAFELLEKNL